MRGQERKIALSAEQKARMLPLKPEQTHKSMPNTPSDHHEESGQNADVITQARPKIKKPNLYRVLLLNDDYTPMDFVVYVLEHFFHKNREEAMHIMLSVHHNGAGECGVFTYEVAEAKVVQVMDCARRNEHPLQCVIDKK